MTSRWKSVHRDIKRIKEIFDQVGTHDPFVNSIFVPLQVGSKQSIR